MNERLVYAEQNTTTKTNDLIVVNNDSSYYDSGIVVGPNDTFGNLRISYNINQAKAHVVTNTFSIDAPSVMVPNIQSATLTTKAYKYVVMDTDGSLLEGYIQYQGDINQTINTITDNISVLESTITTVVNRLNNLTPGLIPTPTPTPEPPPPVSKDSPMIWIYAILGVLFLLLILCLVLWFWYRRSSSELKQMKADVNALKQWMDKQNLPVCAPPLPACAPALPPPVQALTEVPTAGTKSDLSTPSTTGVKESGKMDTSVLKKKMMDLIIGTV